MMFCQMSDKYFRDCKGKFFRRDDFGAIKGDATRSTDGGGIGGFGDDRGG